jgi:hypothetical protein
VKYDDASWHYGGDFPSDLEPINGATHIAMFITWCLLNDLAGSLHLDEFPDALNELAARQQSPAAWFVDNCDEKFTDEDLNTQGNLFALYYYNDESSPFYSDYETAVGSDAETLYHIEDSWETYDKLGPVFKKRFDEWRELEGSQKN